jgi:hypothetical protein
MGLEFLSFIYAFVEGAKIHFFRHPVMRVKGKLKTGL